MVNNMNRLKTLLLVLPALILVVSCGDDFTILAPQSERNVENFYQSDTDFRVAINGAYAGLAGNDLYGRNFMLLHEMRSDNTFNGGGATGLAESLQRITRFDELPGSTELENTWAGGYKVIASVNTILSRIDNVEFDNPSLADRIKGEALFIRSLVYYNLAVTYGNIPIQLDEVTSPNVEINQVSAEVIYDQIITDLGTAENLLPASYSAEDIGRGTSGGFTEYYSTDLSISGGVGGGNVPQGINDNLLETYDENDDVRFETYGTDIDGLPFLNKYDFNQTIAFDSDVNFIVFRYADVLLMLAEAIGESPEAYDLIDEVRERSGLTTPSSTLPGTFEEILLLERRREFVGENKRWPDLLRFGVAPQVMADFLSDEGFSPSDIRLLYPIPQRELDAAPGELTQNQL